MSFQNITQIDFEGNVDVTVGDVNNEKKVYLRFTPLNKVYEPGTSTQTIPVNEAQQTWLVFSNTNSIDTLINALAKAKELLNEDPN